MSHELNRLQKPTNPIEIAALLEESKEKDKKRNNRQKASQNAAQKISFVVSGVSESSLSSVLKYYIAALKDPETVEYDQRLGSVLLLTEADRQKLLKKYTAMLEERSS